MKVIASVLFSLLVFAISACSPKSEISGNCPGGFQKDVGIVGGKTVHKDSPLASGTVFLVMYNKDESSSTCTGVLVGKNIILTAAHCVYHRKDDTSIYAVFSNDPECNVFEKGHRELVRRSEQVLQHEDYNDEYLFNDIALIRIKGVAPTNYQPLPLVLSPIRLPHKAFVAGYGVEVEYTFEGDTKPRLKVATVKPYRKTKYDRKARVPDSLTNESEIVVFDQRNGEGACAGDSGGPSFVKVKNQLAVLGVASSVFSIDRMNKESTCLQGSAYSSVHYFAQWIQTKYSNLRNHETDTDLVSINE